MSDRVLQLERSQAQATTVSTTLEPGAVYGVDQYGESFYVVESPVDVLVKTERTAGRRYKPQTGERFPSGFTFRRLEVYNPSPFPIEITIWAGFGEYVDRRTSVVESPTELVAVDLPANQLSALQSVDLNGYPPPGKRARKAIVVSNLDSANSVCVLDAFGVRACNVFPQSSITLPIAGPCSVFNPSAGNIGCYISEIWYV